MKYKFFILVVGILLLASFVSGFAVSSKYWEGNPVVISPGESETFEVLLQNLAGDEDIFVEGFIDVGGDFISFVDEETLYTVKKGEKVSINLIIEIPKDTKIFGNYSTIISFKTRGGEGSVLDFGASVEREIPLQIIEGEKDSLRILYVLGIALILLVGAFLILRFYLKKSKQAKQI